MGISSHIVGFRPPDEEWQKMKAIWDACQAAGITPPEKVMDFFEDQKPDPAGVSIGLTSSGSPAIYSGAVKVWSDGPRGHCDGYEVDLSILLANYPGLRVLRFYNSY